jgi:hypothetical protein
MPTKSARYQGYEFDIFAPDAPGGRWRVHVWPPSRKPPIIMRTQTSENEAINEAKATVDHLLRSSSQPAT